MRWPRGFSADGLRSGLYKNKTKRDIALFFSKLPAQAAGVFTKSSVKAAPVILSQKRLKKGENVRAILMNSGCANACTGSRGLRDAEQCARWAAAGLGIPARPILAASTGVIGTYLPMKLMKRGVQKLASLVRKPLRADPAGPFHAAQAIMTTDTYPKVASLQITVKGRTVTLWGCAKGSGMIHPKMATMLSTILTDASVTAPYLKRCLAAAVEQTFNRTSVDGETSTNDTVFILANAAATHPRISREQNPGGKELSRAVLEICQRLSRMIAADGEGASKSIWIFVEKAKTQDEAARLAESVATSPLVKTAVGGADANWGRIMGALGKTFIPFDPARVEIQMGDVTVCRNGVEVPFDLRAVQSVLKRNRVSIRILMNRGEAWSHYQTCDFTGRYVDINTGYRS